MYEKILENVKKAAFEDELKKIAAEKGEKIEPGSFSKHVKKEPSSSDKPGEGGRFEALEHKLENKGAKDPGALAAAIGRAKFGKKKFQHMSAAGK